MDIRSLPDAALMTELIRRWPGRRIRVPKREHIPEVEILALVLTEMDATHDSQWRACCRVAGRLQWTPRGVWGVVQRRRVQPRCRANGMDPEYGGR